MPTCGSDFQRALGGALPLHFAHVWIMRRDALGLRDEACQRLAPGQVRGDLQQILCRIDHGIVHQRGFRCIRLRQDESAPAVRRAVGHRQCAAYGPQFTGQREFTGELVLIQSVGGYLPRGGEDADGDGQIETPTLLGQVGGREVDGDATRGEVELAVLQGGAHAILALLHLGLGQADDVELRQAVGEMHLDGDLRRLHAGETSAVQDSKAHDGLLV